MPFHPFLHAPFVFRVDLRHLLQPVSRGTHAVMIGFPCIQDDKIRIDDPLFARDKLECALHANHSHFSLLLQIKSVNIVLSALVHGHHAVSLLPLIHFFT